MDRCSVCFVRFPDVWNPYLWPNCTKCFGRVHLDCLNGQKPFTSAAADNYLCRDCVEHRSNAEPPALQLVPRKAGVSDVTDSGGMQLASVLSTDDSTRVIKVSDGGVAVGRDTLNGCPSDPGNDAQEDTKSGDPEGTLKISDNASRGKSIGDTKSINQKLPPQVLATVTIESWGVDCIDISSLSDSEMLFCDELICFDEEALNSESSDNHCHSAQPYSSGTDESGGYRLPGPTHSMFGQHSGLASAGRDGFAARQSVFKPSHIYGKHVEDAVRAASMARETADAARSFANQTAIKAATAAIKARSALNSAAVAAVAVNDILQRSVLEEVS